MNDITRERILRKLDGLSDETAYQVLDYIEFLESRYGTQAREASPFQKIAETIEDTLRAGRLPVAAVRGTMDAMDTAGRVMRGIVAAGKAAVEGLAETKDSGDSGDSRDRGAGAA